MFTKYLYRTYLLQLSNSLYNIYIQHIYSTDLSVVAYGRVLIISKHLNCICPSINCYNEILYL